MLGSTSLMVFLVFASSMVLMGRTTPNRVANEGVLLNGTSEHQFRSCGAFCQFRLCEFNAEDDVVIRGTGVPFIFPGKPRTASTPWICLPTSSDVLGRVLKAGNVEAKTRDGRYVRLSGLRTSTGRTPFRRGRAIITMQLNAAESGLRKSGIALNRVLSSDQKQILERRCILIPITRYEVLGSNGKFSDIRNVRGRSACVSLIATTQTPSVRLVLHWHNQDDLNIYVTEPNGNRISALNRRSRTGGFLEEVVKGRCVGGNTFREASEAVIWPQSANPLLGEYSVTVEHTSSCREGPAEWFLALFVDEKLTVLGSGNHTISNFVVEIARFTFVLSS